MKNGISIIYPTELITHQKFSRPSSHRIALVSSLLFFILGGVSSAWAGDRVNIQTAPIHLAGFSIHIGPGGGVHLGIGGHRHGFRGHSHYPRKHFGHRNHFKRSRHFYRHFDRQNHGPRFYGRQHNHRGHFKGGRHHRRHRH